jgi:hypothetical protein
LEANGLSRKRGNNLSLKNNFFYGICFPQWIRLLLRHSSSVHPAFSHRILVVTFASIGNSLWKFLAGKRHAKRIESLRSRRDDRPEIVFILGHWRSGTTHLHYLLGSDAARFAAPTVYQVMNPDSFLLTEKRGAPLLNRLLPGTRPMDGLPLGAHLPGEDEFAMALAGLSSPYLGLGFPKQRGFYSRYLTFAKASPSERQAFMKVLDDFIIRLAIRYPGGRLLLKSPAHTARIALLLSRYPDAKFIHIARDPFKVFQSSRHIFESFFPYCNFESIDWDRMDEDILDRYAEVYDAYFSQKSAIPAGNLFELKSENLIADPFGSLEALFRNFGWDHLRASRPHFERYLGSIRDYRPNSLSALTESERERVRARWGKYGSELGYGMN